MLCDWKPVLEVLPPNLKRAFLDTDKSNIQEVRLRRGKSVELNRGATINVFPYIVTGEEIAYIVNAASRYSPWQAQTIAQGYLSIPGGHRIGLCGQAICSDGSIKGIREPDSLCIRIARDVPEIGAAYRNLEGSVLILGAPGWGKTTLLRDLSRQMAQTRTTVVLDERGELFPDGVARGRRMDVLSNCPKAEGLDMVLRTMGPEIIAVDEITREADCEAMLQASHCGVQLLATAHAVSVQDFENRPVYRLLKKYQVFHNILVLRKDKSCSLERMTLCN